MKRNIHLLVLAILFFSCSTKKTNNSIVSAPWFKYYNTITYDDLKRHLVVIASDEMQGRNTGEEGQRKAGRYIVDFYKKNGISFPPGAHNFYQPIPSAFFSKAFTPRLGDSENIWAFIEGSEKPQEILVVSAHYDHVGTKNGAVYNGADDDGSGTVALMEMAQSFIQAKKDGKGPKRSILFLHVTAEEHGLHGSRYYTENPLFPLANTIANINIDMIGRRDDLHNATNNYIYLIGSDYLSTDLYEICEEANKKSVNIELDYKYNSRSDPNRFYYRSDHYNFAKNNIPSVFLFNGVHEDYHQASDEVSKIEFDALTKRTKLAFVIAWDLANKKSRPEVDKIGNNR
jgi:hypothetical protein